jgi:hypothetical protein
MILVIRTTKRISSCGYGALIEDVRAPQQLVTANTGMAYPYHSVLQSGLAVLPFVAEVGYIRVTIRCGRIVHVHQSSPPYAVCASRS